MSEIGAGGSDAGVSDEASRRTVQWQQEWDRRRRAISRLFDYRAPATTGPDAVIATIFDGACPPTTLLGSSLLDVQVALDPLDAAALPEVVADAATMDASGDGGGAP